MIFIHYITHTCAVVTAFLKLLRCYYNVDIRHNDMPQILIKINISSLRPTLSHALKSIIANEFPSLSSLFLP